MRGFCGEVYRIESLEEGNILFCELLFTAATSRDKMGKMKPVRIGILPKCVHNRCTLGSDDINKVCSGSVQR